MLSSNDEGKAGSKSAVEGVVVFDVEGVARTYRDLVLLSRSQL